MKQKPIHRIFGVFFNPELLEDQDLATVCKPRYCEAARLT